MIWDDMRNFSNTAQGERNSFAVHIVREGNFSAASLTNNYSHNTIAEHELT